MSTEVFSINCSCGHRTHRLHVFYDVDLNWVSFEYTLEPSSFFVRIKEAFLHILGYSQECILGEVLLDYESTEKLILALQTARDKTWGTPKTPHYFDGLLDEVRKKHLVEGSSPLRGVSIDKE